MTTLKVYHEPGREASDRRVAKPVFFGKIFVNIFALSGKSPQNKGKTPKTSAQTRKISNQ
jgi:hypothetical protein